MESEFFFLLLSTILAGFLGYELISKIPQTLHTPLMSGPMQFQGLQLSLLLHLSKSLAQMNF